MDRDDLLRIWIAVWLISMIIVPMIGIVDRIDRGKSTPVNTFCMLSPAVFLVINCCVLRCYSYQNRVAQIPDYGFVAVEIQEEMHRCP